LPAVLHDGATAMNDSANAVPFIANDGAEPLALLAERERAEVTLDSIGDGVISADENGKVTYLNPVAERLTGWSRTEASGRKLSDVFRIIDGDTRQPAANSMELAIREDRPAYLPSNTVLVRRDGSALSIEDSVAPIHGRNGKVIGAVLIFRDVSEARVMARTVSHLAQHDFLTGLPNRALLNDRLDQAMALARRHGNKVAVLFLDIDRFKDINDSLGHAVGDKLLQGVGNRLRVAVRSSDTVSRQGGDEFVVVLSEVEHAQNAARQAEKIQAALSSPIGIGLHDLPVNVSIGISIFPDDGVDAAMLVGAADTAMYHAKKSGRNAYRFFKLDMDVEAVERESVAAQLRRALEGREFVLHYQQKRNLDTGAISGLEALIRWPHPERGLLPAVQFVRVAEDCGQIVPLGRWVLREVCRQARAWQQAGLAPMPVAVNISALEFRHKDFVAGVRTICAETGLNPRYLELEIAESVLMHDVEFTARVLRDLKSIGVLVAVDNFGTGYSSLICLRNFSIGTLKIDQRFVHGCTTNPDDGAIVSAVISLGRSLGLRVIAVGVETSEQLEFLRTRLCDEGQGCYFGQPGRTEAFTQVLDAAMAPPAARSEGTGPWARPTSSVAESYGQSSR
jgi:diguanylate cyclase (GGDEF)-like protein/PAS domain S-box-containing protein